MLAAQQPHGYPDYRPGKRCVVIEGKATERLLRSLVEREMIGVGIVGYGYWGPNLVRNFTAAPGMRVAAICDQRRQRLAQARVLCPTAELVTDYSALLANPEVDVVAIATPVATHYGLASAALESGRHVFIEKPLTASAEQAERLIDAAERRNLRLMVDHTFVYTDAVRKIKELVSGGELGDIYYYDSVRVNLGLFQHDVNVIWDLAVHDLSILDYILGRRPCVVSATGVNHLPGQPANIAYLSLFFEGSLMAHIHANWLAPAKVRRTLIGGSQKMIVYDDLEPSEKIKVYDRGVTVTDDIESMYHILVNYRMGDMWAPHLDTAEALRRAVAHFAECLESGASPLTDGRAGLRVVEVLEAANESMAMRGRPVEVDARVTVAVPA